MKRNTQIDDVFVKLKKDIFWKAERKEVNRSALMAKMADARSENQQEQRKPRLIPITAFVLMLAIFGTLIFQFVSDKDDLTEGKNPEVTNKEDVKPNEEENHQQPNGTTEESKSLADQYEKEKTMEIELEGTKETVSVVLATNEALRYIIYYEKDGYEFIQEERVDKIIFPNEDERYPEVMMEIKKSQYSTVKEAIQEVGDEVMEEGMRVEISEEVTWPLTATRIFAYDQGKPFQWDSPVHKYYVTEQAGEVFIIKQKYFLEASEGIGARFDNMLTTFEVIPE